MGNEHSSEFMQALPAVLTVMSLTVALPGWHMDPMTAAPAVPSAGNGPICDAATGSHDYGLHPVRADVPQLHASCSA
jgi:hypothetical protein